MSNRWVESVKKNLLPLSKEKTDLNQALSEWFYTGDTYDLTHPEEDCELCDHPGIRFQFEIKNQHTKEVLLIGSECILRFSISAIDDEGNVLDQVSTTKKVHQDRRKLISNARTKRVITSLVDLSQKDKEFDDINNSIEYFQERGAFSPRHLLFLLWRMKKSGVSFNKTDFKMTIRRNREKDQLLAMKDWEVRKIKPAMSAAQQKWYQENS
jgi:hypothetical protein